MASFPAEILSDIFLASIPVLGNSDNLPAYFPWTLSHVCHHWRASALAFPKLWSFLDVEQTQANEEDRSPELLLMETYLERSRQHPLTFHLAYSYETMHAQPFLELLESHCARWQNVFLESPNHYALEHLAQGDPSEYPLLRSLVCSYYSFDSDAISEGPIFHPIPWSQLQRYHEYECDWSPDCDRQWTIMSQLTNVVELRSSFYGESDGEEAIEMPYLRFASLAVDSSAEELDIGEILNCFDFPGIQGLNLKLMTNHSPDVLSPVPDQLKGLKILRLCGALAISKTALLGILTGIESLTDFAVELRGIDAADVFALLTPTNSESVLVPRLRALRVHRVTEFERVEGTVDALLAMLRQRFGGVKGVAFACLERFQLSLQGQPSTLGPDATLLDILRLKTPADGPTNLLERPLVLLNRLESLKIQEGWDIRVDEDWWGEFWAAEMDGEFV